MVQQAYDRATRLGDTVYVVTEASHAEALRAQLPELPDESFLIEPGRRGTAHCIIFALDYIARHHDHSEPVAFIHSDHNVRDLTGFAHSFATAGKISTENNEIVLIGIEPTFPSTGFGYIERDGVLDEEAGVYNVESFKEKPDFDTAQHYVESGNYLELWLLCWFGGYFPCGDATKCP
jgi:mannose-1-phosphate guanylyltransferase